MKHLLIALTVALLTGSALAQGPDTRPTATPQIAGQDLTKMGPWTRKPINEAQIRREVTDFFKQEELLMKRGDFDAMAARIDFPVFMATDDAKGVPAAKLFEREEYVSMMKPFYEDWPKDAKVVHRPTITVLSDSLVSYVDDFTMTIGQQRLSGRSNGLIVKRDGQWKWKVMAEAGWGDLPQPGVGGSPEPEPPVLQE